MPTIDLFREDANDFTAAGLRVTAVKAERRKVPDGELFRYKGHLGHLRCSATAPPPFSENARVSPENVRVSEPVCSRQTMAWGYRSSGPSPAMYRHPIHRQRRRYGRPNWSRPPAFGRCKRQAPFDRHCSPFNRKGSSGQRQNASLCRKINQHKEAFLFYYGMKNMKKQDSGATDRSLSCFARITSHAMQLFFDHPLTEPIMTPVTKYFCTKG